MSHTHGAKTVVSQIKPVSTHGSINLKTSFSHRFTQINTDKPLCV
jgi:hypothetical protein